MKIDEQEDKEHILLKVDGLKQVYANNVIFQNLSFDVKSGEILGIVGNSGVGKTTLMFCLGLLRSFEEGTITYNFRDGQTNRIFSGKNHVNDENQISIEKDTVISKKTRNGIDKTCRLLRKKYFGFIFQRPYTLSHFNILDNIWIPLWITNKNPEMKMEFLHTSQSYQEIIKDWIKKLEIEQEFPEIFQSKSQSFFQKLYNILFARKSPSQLSVGQLSRVAVIRGMIHEPQIIFADEPTASVGNIGNKVLNLMKDYISATKEKSWEHTKSNQQASSLVIISHDEEIITQYTDRILLLHPGYKTGYSILSKGNNSVEDYLKKLRTIRDESASYLQEKNSKN